MAPNWKPAKGTAYLAGRQRRADRRDAEQRVMRAAKRRDKHACRWPGCDGKFRGLPLPIDACHAVHRGPGGNPDGSRTASSAQILSLCRVHHRQWDAHLVDAQPLTDAGFDGPVAFFMQHAETGRMEHVASETARGVSVEPGK